MTEDLFSYGSLREHDVQKRVIGRVIKGVPDCLDGYNTSTIKLYDKIYPILILEPNHSIDGVILSLTPEELSKVDQYETDAYERVRVTLRSGKKVWVYQSPDLK